MQDSCKILQDLAGFCKILQECKVITFLVRSCKRVFTGNVLSVIKNFLNIHSLTLNIPSLPTLMTNYIEFGQTGFVLTPYCLM